MCAALCDLRAATFRFIGGGLLLHKSWYLFSMRPASLISISKGGQFSFLLFSVILPKSPLVVACALVFRRVTMIACWQNFS